MDFEIIKENDNALLKRKEIRVRIKHPNASTPSKDSLLTEIAGKYGKEKDFIVIDYMFTKKGFGETEAVVKVYEEKPKKIVKKGEKKEGEKIEAQAGQAK